MLRSHRRGPRPHPLLSLAAALLLGGLLGPVLSAALAAQELCLDCHEVDLGADSIHAVLGCTDCHMEIEGYPHPETITLGDAVCAQCHDAGETMAGSVHAELTACVDCHGDAHAVLPPSDLDSPVSPVKQFQTCGQCHDGEGLISAYLESVHARALLVSGLVTAPSCSDCHGSHEILPHAEPASRLSRDNVPTTCGECHGIILERWTTASAHGIGWQEGDAEVPICSTCHASHRVLRPTEPAQRLRAPETCGDCHGEQFLTYRDSFHGQVTDLGFVTAAICSDCHTPHANVAASDPRSSVHPERLAETCGSCHGAVSEGFLSFDPHADPTDGERYPRLHFIHTFMVGLLFAVFGFFGLHDLLWLQRSLVGAIRGEFHTASKLDRSGPYVRRFTTTQIWIHVTVVVTFLILAMTGLPLKFHFTEWARGLSGLLGGVGSTRFLHRIAAVATFGYFLFHVGQLFRRGVVDKEPGLLWGWKSMVPRPKDFADLFVHLRYFLYLGRRPAFDRFTYWEKFDYFAVFWGVVIIGSSGLALWFPSLFTRVLPGWTLNAASIVHGEEALLAVGFIFVFHFFHSHLRPESFPLDPVVFVGRMPLERFKEERPLEYQRMVERGELEEHLVEPPTRRQMLRARIFGFTALGIGLLLALAILWALAGY